MLIGDFLRQFQGIKEINFQAYPFGKPSLWLISQNIILTNPQKVLVQFEFPCTFSLETKFWNFQHWPTHHGSYWNKKNQQGKQKNRKTRRGMNEQSRRRLKRIKLGKTWKTLFLFQITAHTCTPLNGIHLGTVNWNWILWNCQQGRILAIFCHLQNH